MEALESKLTCKSYVHTKFQAQLLLEGNMLFLGGARLGCYLGELLPHEHGWSLGEHIYILPQRAIPREATMFPQGPIMFETLCEHNFCMWVLIEMPPSTKL